MFRFLNFVGWLTLRHLNTCLWRISTFTFRCLRFLLELWTLIPRFTLKSNLCFLKWLKNLQVLFRLFPKRLNIWRLLIFSPLHFIFDLFLIQSQSQLDLSIFGGQLLFLYFSQLLIQRFHFELVLKNFFIWLL